MPTSFVDVSPTNTPKLTASHRYLVLPSISSEFNKSNQASWLGTARVYITLVIRLANWMTPSSYLLSVCTFTPLYGRLCNAIGRKGACILALSFFGIGIVGCGLSTNMEMLIAARFVSHASMPSQNLRSWRKVDFGYWRRRTTYHIVVSTLQRFAAGISLISEESSSVICMTYGYVTSQVIYFLILIVPFRLSQEAWPQELQLFLTVWVISILATLT